MAPRFVCIEVELKVFVSGATGYLGRALVEQLVARGISVTALARPGSASRVPPGARVHEGDALRSESFAAAAAGHFAFVHLTGVAHPAPWKEAAFRAVDQVSFRASLRAARSAGAGHFIYVSVAHPAPVMRAYQAVRRECEAELEASGLPWTVLRPWYVTGPGHRWPLSLRPLYRMAEGTARWREAAGRLGLVTQGEMTGALVWSVLNAPAGRRLLTVPGIRAAARGAQ
jgi:uncharacterized protein YbjT (DUF2867 family)